MTTSKEPGTEDASRGVYEQVVLEDMQGVAMWQLHLAGADTDSANTAHTTLNYFTRSITRSPAQGTLQGAASEQVVLEDVQGVALWQLHLAAADTGSTRLSRHNTIAFTPPHHHMQHLVNIWGAFLVLRSAEPPTRPVKPPTAL